MKSASENRGFDVTTLSPLVEEDGKSLKSDEKEGDSDVDDVEHESSREANTEDLEHHVGQLEVHQDRQLLVSIADDVVASDADVDVLHTLPSSE